jgi:phage-related protein
MTGERLTEIPVIFYRSSGGVEPVIDWLRGLPAEDRQVIGTDLSTVQFGWPVGMPLCRPLGSGLWEVRSTLPSRRIARLLFFVHGGRIGVVHGFVKKTQKTPAEDLALARKRMKEMKV